MNKAGFLYFSFFIVILVSGAFNLFDHVNLKPGVQLNDELMKHRWIISEVRELEEKAGQPNQQTAGSWQFLKEKQFVQFSNDILVHSGEWSLKGNKLHLLMADEQQEKIFTVERKRKNELMLISDQQEIRLLKLSN